MRYLSLLRSSGVPCADDVTPDGEPATDEPATAPAVRLPRGVRIVDGRPFYSAAWLDDRHEER